MKLSYNTTLGFALTRPTLQRTKVESTLNKLQRFSGEYMTEKELVVRYLLQGFTVEKQENYSYLKRNGEMSKPKTRYKLYCGETSFYEITKTAYDFALYLIENNFTTVESIATYISAEKAEAERLEAERVANEERKQKDLKDRLKAEKEQAKKERQLKLDNWNKIALELLSSEQVKEIKDIIFNVTKRFVSDSITDENIKLSIENSEFITTLGNEKATTSRVNYIFLDCESEHINRNMHSSIEKAIYTYVFDLSESESNLTIKDKINKFYTGTEKKRYYHGAESEKEKLRLRIIEIVENMVAESNDEYEFRQSVTKHKETLLPLIKRCEGLRVLMKPDHVLIKYQDAEYPVYFKYVL